MVKQRKARESRGAAHGARTAPAAFLKGVPSGPSSAVALPLLVPAMQTRLMQYRWPLLSGRLCPRCAPQVDTISPPALMITFSANLVRVWGFRVQGSGWFRVQGLGFRV